MILPDYIRVGAKRYRVTLETLEGDGAGESDHYEDLILLDEGLTGSYLREVLLHETLHAASYFMGADLSEQQVDVLARGLLMVLRDNPGLVDMLTEDA